MTKLHGSFGQLYLDDQAGTCQNMTSATQSITFTRSKNNPEATTFGNHTVQRIDGLRDLTMDVTSVFDSSGSASSIIGLLDAMYSGSLTSRAQYLPAGSVSGCPIYTASMRLSNYANNQPVDGIVTANYSLQIASGSMTSACIT